MREEKHYGFCAAPPRIWKVKGGLSINVCQVLLFLIHQPELPLCSDSWALIMPKALLGSLSLSINIWVKLEKQTQLDRKTQ